MRSDALAKDHPALAERTRFVVASIRSVTPKDRFYRNFDDITQIALLASWETLVRGESHFDATRHARRRIRRELDYQRRKVDEFEAEFESMEWAECERAEVIPDRYFARCSKRQTAVLRLLYENDMDVNTICEFAGMTRCVVRNLLQKGQRRVRMALA